MKLSALLIFLVCVTSMFVACSDDDSTGGSSSQASSSSSSSSSAPAALPVTACAADSFRVATFNIQNLTSASLRVTNHTTVLKAAAIIKLVRPDILVLNEIDHDYVNLDKGLAHNARLLATNYLMKGTNGIVYPYAYAAACNTGINSGIDLNGNGVTATTVGAAGYGDDCYGYGDYVGEYSIAILSRYPITDAQARAFRTMLWKDLPNNSMPTQGFWTNANIQANFRLSSKSHWDVPVVVNAKTIHLLLSHPTPPGFDSSPYWHNRRRNHDEIKFWAHYITNDFRLKDDSGAMGGLATGSSFVIAGDLNCYPNSTTYNWDNALAINFLLTNANVLDPGTFTVSAGGASGKATGAPKYYERTTATWGDGARVDYVLPNKTATVTGGGVYWPLASADPTGAAYATSASDHHLVWVDIAK